VGAESAPCGVGSGVPREHRNTRGARSKVFFLGRDQDLPCLEDVGFKPLIVAQQFTHLIFKMVVLVWKLCSLLFQDAQLFSSFEALLDQSAVRGLGRCERFSALLILLVRVEDGRGRDGPVVLLIFDGLR
jgi:hypothetical protein